VAIDVSPLPLVPEAAPLPLVPVEALDPPPLPALVPLPAPVPLVVVAPELPAGSSTQVPAMHSPPGQGAPSGLEPLAHSPLLGSQTPSYSQGPLEEQSISFTGFEQAPVAGSQTPTSWQPSLAMQGFCAPPTQAPARQLSALVQAFPSSQGEPSGLIGSEQTPVFASQAPTSWQPSSAAQTTGDAPVQVPAWQPSTVVQASPSSQAAPSAWSGLVHAPVAGSQTPAT